MATGEDLGIVVDDSLAELLFGAALKRVTAQLEQANGHLGNEECEEDTSGDSTLIEDRVVESTTIHTAEDDIRENISSSLDDNVGSSSFACGGSMKVKSNTNESLTQGTEDEDVSAARFVDPVQIRFGESGRGVAAIFSDPDVQTLRRYSSSSSHVSQLLTASVAQASLMSITVKPASSTRLGSSPTSALARLDRWSCRCGGAAIAAAGAAW